MNCNNNNNNKNKNKNKRLCWKVERITHFGHAWAFLLGELQHHHQPTDKVHCFETLTILQPPISSHNRQSSRTNPPAPFYINPFFQLAEYLPTTKKTKTKKIKKLKKTHLLWITQNQKKRENQRWNSVLKATIMVFWDLMFMFLRWMLFSQPEGEGCRAAKAPTLLAISNDCLCCSCRCVSCVNKLHHQTKIKTKKSKNIPSFCLCCFFLLFPTMIATRNRNKTKTETKTKETQQQTFREFFFFYSSLCFAVSIKTTKMKKQKSLKIDQKQCLLHWQSPQNHFRFFEIQQRLPTPFFPLHQSCFFFAQFELFTNCVSSSIQCFCNSLKHQSNWWQRWRMVDQAHNQTATECQKRNQKTQKNKRKDQAQELWKLKWSSGFSFLAACQQVIGCHKWHNKWPASNWNVPKKSHKPNKTTKTNKKNQTIIFLILAQTNQTTNITNNFSAKSKWNTKRRIGIRFDCLEQTIGESVELAVTCLFFSFSLHFVFCLFVFCFGRRVVAGNKKTDRNIKNAKKEFLFGIKPVFCFFWCFSQHTNTNTNTKTKSSFETLQTAFDGKKTTFTKTEFPKTVSIFKLNDCKEKLQTFWFVPFSLSLLSLSFFFFFSLFVSCNFCSQLCVCQKKQQRSTTRAQWRSETLCSPTHQLRPQWVAVICEDSSSWSLTFVPPSTKHNQLWSKKQKMLQDCLLFLLFLCSWSTHLMLVVVHLRNSMRQSWRIDCELFPFSFLFTSTQTHQHKHIFMQMSHKENTLLPLRMQSWSCSQQIVSCEW